MPAIFLDLKTLEFVLLTVTFVLSPMMIFIWRTNKTYAGFELWMFANVLLCAGFFVMSLDEFAPSVYSFVISNSLCLGGVLTSFEGSRKFLGLSRCYRFSAAILVLHAAALFYFSLGQNSLSGQIISTSLI